MKRIRIKCLRCGKTLFFSISDNYPKERGPIIEVQCSRDRCGAKNLVDYRDPKNIIVRLKE